MMTDATVIENGNALMIEIDTNIYPDVVIDKVLYWSGNCSLQKPLQTMMILLNLISRISVLSTAI